MLKKQKKRTIEQGWRHPKILSSHLTFTWKLMEGARSNYSQTDTHTNKAYIFSYIQLFEPNAAKFLSIELK